MLFRSPQFEDMPQVVGLADLGSDLLENDVEVLSAQVSGAADADVVARVLRDRSGHHSFFECLDEKRLK